MIGQKAKRLKIFETLNNKSLIRQSLPNQAFLGVFIFIRFTVFLKSCQQVQLAVP